ncbi:hypothetical protein D3C72_1546250 [compost metagenome]
MAEPHAGVILCLAVEREVTHESCPIFCCAGLCQYPRIQRSSIAEQLQRIHFARKVEQLVAILHHHSEDRAGDVATYVEGAQAKPLCWADLLL